MYNISYIKQAKGTISCKLALFPCADKAARWGRAVEIIAFIGISDIVFCVGKTNIAWLDK